MTTPFVLIGQYQGRGIEITAITGSAFMASQKETPVIPVILR
jgi:hypothetical protein